MVSRKLTSEEGKRMMKRNWELRRAGKTPSEAMRQARAEILGDTPAPAAETKDEHLARLKSQVDRTTDMYGRKRPDDNKPKMPRCLI